MKKSKNRTRLGYKEMCLVVAKSTYTRKKNQRMIFCRASNLKKILNIVKIIKKKWVKRNIKGEKKETMLEKLQAVLTVWA